VDLLSSFCVMIGSLIVLTRGPMIFAPRSTLRFAHRLVASDLRIRTMGALLAPLALALIALPVGGGAAAGFLRALGWLWAAVTVWLLAAPGSYRRFARGVLAFFESSVDEAAVRIFGLVAVAIGCAMVYLGMYVV